MPRRNDSVRSAVPTSTPGSASNRLIRTNPKLDEIPRYLDTMTVPKSIHTYTMAIDEEGRMKSRIPLGTRVRKEDVLKKNIALSDETPSTKPVNEFKSFKYTMISHKVGGKSTSTANKERFLEHLGKSERTNIPQYDTMTGHLRGIRDEDKSNQFYTTPKSENCGQSKFVSKNNHEKSVNEFEGYCPMVPFGKGQKCMCTTNKERFLEHLGKSERANIPQCDTMTGQLRGIQDEDKSNQFYSTPKSENCGQSKFVSENNHEKLPCNMFEDLSSSFGRPKLNHKMLYENLKKITRCLYELDSGSNCIWECNTEETHRNLYMMYDLILKFDSYSKRLESDVVDLRRRLIMAQPTLKSN